jgi:hypothetical protein
MLFVIICYYTKSKERFTTGQTIQYIVPKNQESRLRAIPNQRMLTSASAAMFFITITKNSIAQIHTTRNLFSSKPRIPWMSKVDRTIFFIKKLVK